MRERWLLAGLLGSCALGVIVPSMVAAQVNIGINIGTPPPSPPPIVLTAPPQFVVIPGTQVFYAPDVPHNYFFYGGKYYTFHEGAWFLAPAHHGPWTFLAVEHVPPPLRRVPPGYYKVPPAIVRTKVLHHGRARVKATNTTNTTISPRRTHRRPGVF
jgi:hypothetical protein